MTNREIIQILTTFGWALLCGVLIFMVPISWRRALNAETTFQRIGNFILCLFCAVGFAVCAWYLWNYRVPKSDSDVPPPATALPTALPSSSSTP